MTYIKKMVMQGFKSFAKKTEVQFDKGINIFVGANGSGKSNISDALCFVLGRLSIKSMRAAKAKNLLFMGSKSVKPSKEAYVEIVFDNQDKTFNLPNQEIVIKRIIRHNGQSIYKINNETKTRGDVIEMLAQAGIDPHGFNLILQGQIQAVVKMHSEDRRKILEEVSGISIYESRKEKSLKELEKTEARLKEISTILRERTLFLKNLERERAQALKYKELEKTIQRCKYSIFMKRITDKEKEIESVKKSISEKNKHREKIKSKIQEIQNKIESQNEQINQINTHIKHSTGIERDSLQEKISDLRAELEGLKVRKESNERRKDELERRIEQMSSSIPEYKKEISELKEESPKLAKKQDSLSIKKKELALLEEQKNKTYSIKTEVNSLRERAKAHEIRISKLNTESDLLIKQIEEISKDFKHPNQDFCIKFISKSKKEISDISGNIKGLAESYLSYNKTISSAETQISSAEEIKKRIEKIDICPLCRNKMTGEHISHVLTDSEDKIKEAKKSIKELQEKLEETKKQTKLLEDNLFKIKENQSSAERELSNHTLINEKKQYLKKLIDEIKSLEDELSALKDRKDKLEIKSIDLSSITEKYNSKLHEIEEISSRTEQDLDTTLLFKERELEKIMQAINQNKKDLEDIESDIQDIRDSIEGKTDTLEIKESEEADLNKKFKKMFDDRDALQKTIQQENFNLTHTQAESSQIEDQINYLKIGDARLEAERDALKMELLDLPKSEVINAPIKFLEEKLEKAKNTLQVLGSINLRALEVYDGVKEEYDKVYEKTQILEKEKEEILKIIQEIDNKKRRTFMKTFKGINELFSRNFAQLSTKGEAFLEIQNPDDLFSGGIDIVIKMAKGKYFDVTSLSGGEQTLIALSLLFAIQEFKPYHFYIFDEIDAALDKRNSERLSSLLKKYMKNGQYIVVTHNDAIITDSDFLYGVSMHEGVSKILSLKIN
ncbi:MAG: chromosome segregation SMC family protein [Candidatus Pacearchaeota archaeon]|nr:chromosome segregation SMC family protein [Candidatus Pacearchaeota archaeon]